MQHQVHVKDHTGRDDVVVVDADSPLEAEGRVWDDEGWVAEVVGAYPTGDGDVAAGGSYARPGEVSYATVAEADADSELVGRFLAGPGVEITPEEAAAAWFEDDAAVAVACAGAAAAVAGDVGEQAGEVTHAAVETAGDVDVDAG